VMVEDINPGPGATGAASGGPTGGTALGDKLIFAARGKWPDAPGYTDDSEPWVSDGTAGGTFRLKDINTAAASTLFGNTPYFAGHPFIPVGDDSILFGAAGALYRSDGTPAGTRRLASLYLPEEVHSRGHGWAALGNGRSVFAASEAPNGGVLYLYGSDGTAEGTRRLVGLYLITPIPVVNGFAYFVGIDLAHGPELWKTDGTPEGTSVVKDIGPGPLGGSSTAPAPSAAASPPPPTAATSPPSATPCTSRAATSSGAATAPTPAPPSSAT
jgi:ELWxxDGT repeat protein